MRDKGIKENKRSRGISIQTKAYIIAILLSLAVSIIFVVVTNSEMFKGTIQSLKGELIGNSYTIWAYDNYGEKTIELHGDKITMNNRLDTFGEESSYIDITIDGQEWNHVGGTLVFAQDGIDMITDFNNIGVIESESSSTGLMAVDKFINNYKNMMGKKCAVLVYSQMGTPVCMFEGDKCYFEIPNDLPKTTKISIDGKLVYVHRANIDIIPIDLIS